MLLYHQVILYLMYYNMLKYKPFEICIGMNSLIPIVIIIGIAQDIMTMIGYIMII